MNAETTTIQQIDHTDLLERAPQESEDSQLRPLPYETLGMVGGGSSIVLL